MTESLDSASVDAGEISRFAAIAEEWWDPEGKFKPLHQLNPVRLGYVRDRICQHFDRDDRSNMALAGLKLLDIGCGGGLLSEPLARQGGTVIGIDPSEKTVLNLVEKIGDARTEMEVNRVTGRLEMRQQLTPEQLDKMLVLREGRGSRRGRGEGGGHRRGGSCDGSGPGQGCRGTQSK